MTKIPDPPPEDVFAHARMPRFRGPLPSPLGATVVPDTGCCEDPSCKSRAHSQAVVLTLDRLTQAYAAFLYLGWATAGMWMCTHGRPEDCPDPGCTFGREQLERLQAVELSLEITVQELFEALAHTPIDLTAEWQAFFEIEQARNGLRDLGRRATAGAISASAAGPMIREYLRVWQTEATTDFVDYEGWLEPAVPEDGTWEASD